MNQLNLSVKHLLHIDISVALAIAGPSERDGTDALLGRKRNVSFRMSSLTWNNSLRGVDFY